MNQNQKGLAQIPLVIGMVLMAIAVPAAMKLNQQSMDNRGSAKQVQCRTNDDCSNGWVCSNNNFCVPNSNVKIRPECEQGKGRCVGSMMVRECSPEGKLGLPKNCGAGMFCREGKCIPEVKGYKCTPNGKCSETNKGGDYQTLEQCQANCNVSQIPPKPTGFQVKPTVPINKILTTTPIIKRITPTTQKSPVPTIVNKVLPTPRFSCRWLTDTGCRYVPGCRWMPNDRICDGNPTY